jgi:ketosteroid isomerase-like protein
MESDTLRTARDTAWAMSQENVELVWAAYDAIARRDRAALDAILAGHVAPHFEFQAVLTGATYKGVDALRELLADIEDIVGYMPEVQEAVDLDDDVLVVLRMSGRGSQRAVYRSRSRAPCSSALSKASSCPGSLSRPGRKPSKPWGCGSGRRDCCYASAARRSLQRCLKLATPALLDSPSNDGTPAPVRLHGKAISRGAATSGARRCSARWACRLR